MKQREIDTFKENTVKNFKALTDEQFWEQLESMLFVDDYSTDMSNMSIIENDAILAELKRRIEIWRTQ